MADKRADQHPNKNQQDRGPDKSHRFINEKIVRQPMSRRQIARKILVPCCLECCQPSALWSAAR